MLLNSNALQTQSMVVNGTSGLAGSVRDTRSESPNSVGSSSNSQGVFAESSNVSYSIGTGSPNSSFGNNHVSAYQPQSVSPNPTAPSPLYSGCTGDDSGTMAGHDGLNVVNQQQQQQMGGSGGGFSLRDIVDSVDPNITAAPTFVEPRTASRPHGHQYLHLSPNRSPLQGGGELLLFYASSQSLPEGNVELTFVSPSGQEGSHIIETVLASKINPFICVAQIPPHNTAEQVTVFVTIARETVGEIPFHYYADVLPPPNGSEMIDLQSQLGSICGLLSGVMPPGSAGGSDEGDGSSTYRGEGNYGAYHRVLALAITLDLRKLAKVVLSTDIGVKCLSMPLADERLLEDYAEDLGQVQIAACMKSLRLRNQHSVSSASGSLQVGPLELLDAGDCSPVACVGELTASVSMREKEHEIVRSKLELGSDDEDDNEQEVTDETLIASKLEGMQLRPSLKVTAPSMSVDESKADADSKDTPKQQTQSEEVPAPSAEAVAPESTAPGSNESDSTEHLKSIIGHMSRRLQQASIQAADNRLVMSMLLRQSVQALHERQQLAAQLLEAQKKIADTVDSDEEDVGIDLSKEEEEEFRDRGSTLTRASVGRATAIHITPVQGPYHGTSIELSDDEDEDNSSSPDVLKSRIKGYKSTIARLRSDQRVLAMAHEEAETKLNEVLISSSKITRTKTVRTRRRYFHDSRAGGRGTGTAGSSSAGYQSSGYQSCQSVDSPAPRTRVPHVGSQTQAGEGGSEESFEESLDFKTLMEEHELTLPFNTKDYGLEIEMACFVNAVTQGGVAQKKHGDRLQAGDVIMKINDQPITKLLTGAAVTELLAASSKMGTGPKLSCISPRMAASNSPELTELRPATLDVAGIGSPLPPGAAQRWYARMSPASPTTAGLAEAHHKEAAAK
eukprot:scpid42077/ scgid9236/ 